MHWELHAEQDMEKQLPAKEGCSHDAKSIHAVSIHGGAIYYRQLSAPGWSGWRWVPSLQHWTPPGGTKQLYLR